MKRLNVGLPPDAIQILKEKFVGKLGTNESETIRHIVLIFLTERGYFKNFIRSEGSEKTSENENERGEP